ncbi:MAG: OB-fold nucleic acid binding domain-containing protein [Candidatus Anstonellaceae archaeon]
MEEVKITDLKPGLSAISVKGQIISKEDAREVITKYGKKIKVANAILEDETGSIQISLWGEDSSKYKIGDNILIENGYVSEFKGNPQLSAGKNGKITLL